MILRVARAPATRVKTNHETWFPPSAPTTPGRWRMKNQFLNRWITVMSFSFVLRQREIYNITWFPFSMKPFLLAFFIFSGAFFIFCHNGGEPIKALATKWWFTVGMKRRENTRNAFWKCFSCNCVGWQAAISTLLSSTTQSHKSVNYFCARICHTRRCCRGWCKS